MRILKDAGAGISLRHPDRCVEQCQTEPSEEFGDHVIHHNTVNTDSLRAQAIRSYGITRSSKSSIRAVTVIKMV
jgi:hypothetical protein